MYDVIISGAGPSGSKCAEILAKHGFKVALIEKNTNWRKPCGGGCSLRFYKYYPQLRKLNMIDKHSIAMYSADYSKFQYTYENYNDYSFVMDRLELDNFIRDIAIDAGAELFDNNISFDFIYKNQQKIGIKTKSPGGTKEYFGKIMIVADGMSSKLANKSGIRPNWKTKDLGIAKCAILEGNYSLDINTVNFYFRPYMGYGWIFPIDERRFNIGICTFYEDNFKYNVNYLFKEFINEPEIKKALPESNYKKVWSSAYPEPVIGVLEKSLYSNNLMIVGDAAGFVSPISGEGLYASIVSGNIAALTAVKALEIEDCSEKVLKQYKHHPNIKKIIRNYKLKRSLATFFYEKGGKNLNATFKLAEKNPEFREVVASTFLFNKIPPKDFFSKVQNTELDNYSR
ncbi:MAG: NAD(P)/FAD-dependent oxidoreductase [Candidatus Hodarchaeota archaeon]